MKKKVLLGTTLLLVGVGLYNYTSVSEGMTEGDTIKESRQQSQNSLQTSINQTPTPKTANSSTLTHILESIEKLLTCTDTHTCPEDNSDPRASEFLRASLIVEQIHLLKVYSDSDLAIEKVRELLSYPSGHVQEAALDILILSSASEDNIAPILSMLEKSFDAKIMKQALGELERYPDAVNDYNEVFAQILQTGSMLASNELSKDILPFLSNENIGFYEEVLKKLNPDTQKAKNLKANLFEFSMQQSGG